MTARVVLQIAGRAQWLKFRRSGIGGSEAAVILGCNPWTTPMELWQDKTDRWHDDTIGERYEVRRGNLFEPWLLAEYKRRNPRAVVERAPALLAHPDYPHALASLDGLAHHPDRSLVIECKSAGWRAREPWWDDLIQIPDHYLVQTLWYLAVTGLDAAHVIADVAGEWTQVEVPRDEEWENWAIPECMEWWERHVVADEPPPPDFDRDSIACLNRSFIAEPGTTKKAEGMALGAVKVAAWQAGRVRDHKALSDRLRAQVRTHMGTASALTVDGRKVAYLNAKGVLTVKAPKTDNDTEESE